VQKSITKDDSSSNTNPIPKQIQSQICAKPSILNGAVSKKKLEKRHPVHHTHAE
jgi:hypothetical protein